MSNPESYQPTPDEIKKAEEMMTNRQKKESLERERVNKEGPKNSLLRYAQELNYDDRCGGEALEKLRAELRAIAPYVEKLESVGFTVRVECSPCSGGGASVYLEHNGKSTRIYSQYYDTFSHYSGGNLTAGGIAGIVGKLEMVVETAKMFSTQNENDG